MEISAEKTKVRTNNTTDINTEIKVNEHKLETVTSFNYKYLDSVITKILYTVYMVIIINPRRSLGHHR